MTSDTEPLTLHTDDGRSLEVLVEGPGDGSTVLFHSGTPSAAATFPLLSREASQRGLHLVTYSRPGYGESTPQPRRSVADAAADVTCILDSLGVAEFVTLGWSGGGPHALACGALLPHRCRAVAVLAGIAPYDADGLDWLDGMGPENVEEFGATRTGEPALTAYLQAQRPALLRIGAEDVMESLGGLISDVDKSALTGDFGEFLATSFRRAVLHGVEGWRDDDLAFAKPWGFAPEDIAVPVAIWQGGQDRMVPFAHGEWLADRIRGARAHLDADEGHLSVVQQMGTILDDLLQLAEPARDA